MKEATKEQKSLAELIRMEKERLQGYEKKYAELEKKIKGCKKKIEEYSLMYDREKLLNLTNTLGGKGISVDEIIAAVASGDLTALQDKIDNAVYNTEPDSLDSELATSLTD